MKNVLDEFPTAVKKNKKKTYHRLSLIWAVCIFCNHGRRKTMENQSKKKSIESPFSTIDEDGVGCKNTGNV